jgi:hypothetical protein
MNNHFRDELNRGEVEPEAQPEVKAELPRNFITVFFTEGVISKEAATQMLPFIVFIAFLAMLYIGNRHLAEKSVREINKLNKEVKELSWDFKTIKADLMLKSTQSEVAKKVDTLGLKEPVAPPMKIVVSNSEYKE